MGSACGRGGRAPVTESTAEDTPVVPELHTRSSSTPTPPTPPHPHAARPHAPLLLEDSAQQPPEQRPPWYACCCPRWGEPQSNPRIVLLPMTPARPTERILQQRGGGAAPATATAAQLGRPRASSLSLAGPARRDESGCHSYHATARQPSISAQTMSLSQLIIPSNPKQRGGARTRIVKARTPSGDFTLGAHKAVHLLSSLFAAALSESELAFLSSLAELHHFDRGQSIIVQGTHPSSELYVLCVGEVCVEVEGADGISEEAFDGTAKPSTFHSAAPPNAVKPASNRSRAGSFAVESTFSPCDPAHPIISTHDSAATVPLGPAASSRRQSLASSAVVPPTEDLLSLPASTPLLATQSTKHFTTPASLLSDRRRTLSVSVGPPSHAAAALTISPPLLPSPSVKRASDSSCLFKDKDKDKDKALISPTGAFVLRGQRQAPSPKSVLDASPVATPVAIAAPVYRRLALQSSGFVFGLESVWKFPPPSATHTAAAVATPTLTMDASTPRPPRLPPRSHTSSRRALGQELSSAEASAETTPRATPRGSFLGDSAASSPSVQLQQQQLEPPRPLPAVTDLPAPAAAPSPPPPPSFPRVSNVVALTDCTCLRLSQLALSQFLSRFPHTFDPLLSVLGQHIESSMDSVSFLRVLSHPKRRLFGSLFAAKMVERNTVLFEEGKKCDDDSCMYFLHAGTVRIVLPASGHRVAGTHTAAVTPSRPHTPTAPPTAAVVTPHEPLGGTTPPKWLPCPHASPPQWHEKDLTAGTFFGELSLLLDVDRTATAIASTPCVLLTISRASLRNFMELAPEMLQHFRRNMGGYVQNSYLLLLPHFQASFEEFCEREYSTENLAFWKECNRFKTMAEADSASTSCVGGDGAVAAVLPASLLAMARSIYAEFVADDAPRQVNLRAAHRSVIGSALESGSSALVSGELFVQASREIFALMSSDSFPRFRESELFAAALTKLNQPSTLISSMAIDQAQESKEASSSPMLENPDALAPQTHRAASDSHRRSPFAALRALSSRLLAPSSSTAAAALSPSGASTPPLSPHSPQSRLRSVGALGLLNSTVGESSAPIASSATTAGCARRAYDDQSMDIKDLHLAALQASDLPPAYLQMVQQQRQQQQQAQLLPTPPLPLSPHPPPPPLRTPRSLPSSRRSSLGDHSVSASPLCSTASFRPPPLHPPTPTAGSSPRSIHAALSIPLPLSPTTPTARLRTSRSTVLASTTGTTTGGDLDREGDKQPPPHSKPRATILTSPSASSRNLVVHTALPSPSHTASMFLPSAGADGSSSSAPTTPRLPLGVAESRSPPLVHRQLIAVMRAN